MGKENWRAVVASIEEEIRRGQLGGARQKLHRLRRGRLAREAVLPVANCLRRADLPGAALRLLLPFVRPSRRAPASASPAEIGEYAASLVRLGGIDEALDLLGGVPARGEALLLRTFALVAQWNYRPTIALLETYLREPATAPYERLVATANLVAALVYEREHDRAETTLRPLVKACAREGHGLLLGKALALSAQNELGRGNWRALDHDLAEARRALGPADSLDVFLLRKWRAIADRAREPRSARARRALAAIRDEAVARRHWETIRQCDLYASRLDRDPILARHVYFGTPFAHYRARLREDWEGPFEIPERYHKRYGQGSRVTILDATAGRAGGRALKPGQALHRALLALSADFYRPTRLPTLHRRIYGDEHYDPDSSPERTHRVIRRLREWLRASRVPLRIDADDAGYALNAARAVDLIVSTPSARSSRDEIMRHGLRARWPAESFTAAQAGVVWQITRRAALDVLRAWAATGILAREGRGPATRYRFVIAPPDTTRSR